MQTFLSWLVSEARQPQVDPSILQGYELEFRRRLEQLIQRTTDPVQREKLIGMLDCPIVDARGHCRDFSEYVLAALIKSGVHRRFDIEAALGYVMERMLLDRSTRTGEPRATVFAGFDTDRDFSTGNPFQARFLTFLGNAIKNIQAGRIPRLSNVERRPQGTVSIAPGRQRDDELVGAVPADRIAARPSGHDELEALLTDIRTLLQRKEPAYGLPLVALFDDMMGGMRSAEQRRRHGDRKAKAARQVIVQTIKSYAASSGNFALLDMLGQLEDFNPSKPMEPRRKPQKSVKPKLPPKERDYASIVGLIEKLDRPVSTADLGRYRRRWLDYQPRDPDSPHRNRLDATLAAMVEDGVLIRTPTGRGGYVYSPGAEFARYRELVAA